MRINKIVPVLLSAVLLLFFLSGCAGRGAESGGSPSHYRVGTWKTAQTIQPYFYNQFLEEDTVEVLPFTNPGDMKAALLAGDLDLCGTTWVTAILAAASGEPVRVVGSMTGKCSALVVAADSEIEKPEDLRGARIAYVPGTMHHILLLETLDRAGLDPGQDVELIRIDFFDMGQALAGGQIDAFLSGEPYPTMAREEGYGRILVYPYFDDSIGFINAAMITTADKLETDEAGIRKLMEAHREATGMLQENTSVWLDRAAEFGTDRKILDAAADNMQLAWEITPETVIQVEKLAIRMTELGLIDQVPDLNQLIDSRFISR